MHPKVGSSWRPAAEGVPVARCLALLAMTSLLAPSAHALSARVVITNAPGFTITWDGNDGGFGGNPGPSNNVALASNNTIPFTSSDLGPVINVPFHRAIDLNDGLYGNSQSWISANGVGGTSDPDPFCGLSFDPFSPVNLQSIAWGRDNFGQFHDRSLGTYTLQYTTIASPDMNTVDTGDPTTGWDTIGSVTYLAGTDDASFSSYLRHRFDISQGGSPIPAVTGIRIKVSDGNTDIDEIEVNPIPDLTPPIANFVEILPAAGFAIAWDRNEGNNSASSAVPVNDASVSRGAVAFGSSQLGPVIGVTFHRFTNVNDGLYGNSQSWIPDFASAHPDTAPSIGINFGHRIHIQNIAWSRDNTSGFKDRSLGLYTLQVTTMPDPTASTNDVCGPNADHGWVTVGTINYKTSDPKYFNSYLRHRFDVSEGGLPVSATGLRILVPNNTIDIDEIEVNANTAIEQKIVQITNAPGFSVTWDGNDGQFNDPNPGAGPPLNAALVSQGATPFASSELGPLLGPTFPFHHATNLNDGLYGNSHSWISADGIGGTSDPAPFAGVSFGSVITLTNIAWSRDNGDATAGDTGCGGTCTDRDFDTYSLQYTSLSAPDATTTETGDPTTGWADIGSVTYTKAAPPFFTPYLRHRFDIVSSNSPISATGIRIKVANGNTDIDEIEVNTAVTAPPAPGFVLINPSSGYSILWDGNDGQFYNPAPGAGPPPNIGLASQGTTGFASSELGPILNIAFHRAIDLNDGIYGNSHSWISANGIGGTSDPQPFAGLSFSGTVSITNIAWSRDNGDTTAGYAQDRSLGTFTLEFTQVPSPDATTVETGDATTGWTPIGTVQYLSSNPPDFHTWLRHRFDVSAAGAPISATGLRIIVPDGNTDLDEIEVNTAVTLPAPQVTVDSSSGQPVLFWQGGGALQSAPSLNGPWTCVSGTSWTYPLPATPTGPVLFYRVQQ